MDTQTAIKQRIIRLQRIARRLRQRTMTAERNAVISMCAARNGDLSEPERQEMAVQSRQDAHTAQRSADRLHRLVVLPCATNDLIDEWHTASCFANSANTAANVAERQVAEGYVRP